MGQRNRPSIAATVTGNQNRTGNRDLTSSPHCTISHENAQPKPRNRQRDPKTTTSGPVARPSHENGAGFKTKSPGYDDFAEAYVELEPVQGNTSSVKLFKRLSLAQVMKMPPKEWLIDQIIGPSDLGMIFGAPGSGKTFVGLDLLFAASLGRDFAGRFTVARPLTVAYAAGEGGSGLAQRFQAMAEYYGVSGDDLPNLHVFTCVPQLYDSKDPCNAARFVREYAEAQAAGEVGPLDILILDTLHSVTAGADENSAQHMGQVLREAKRIAEMLGCVVILIHHSNKAGTGERGSSALRGAMDMMIEVKEEGSGRLMKCEKLKDGEAWQPQTFGLIAKADSVRVEWGQVGPSQRNEGKQLEDAQSLIAHLRSADGARYDAKTLAELIGMGGSKQIYNVLKKVTALEPAIQSGLMHPERDSGRGNPLMYWWGTSNE